MEGQKQITAVKRDGRGRNIEFKFEDGTVVDFKQAIQMAQNGEIAHVNAFKGRDGDLHIRSDADGDPSNNLDSLPTFE